MFSTAGRPRILAMKMKPVDMSAKPTGMPRKNRPNMSVMPRTPSVTLLTPVTRCRASHRQAKRTPNANARVHSATAGRRSSSTAASFTSMSRSTASAHMKQPKAAKSRNGAQGMYHVDVAQSSRASA